MKQEIEVAAAWWAEQLAKETIFQDNGDITHMALAMWVRDRQPKPTEKQIEDFRSCLGHLLTELLTKNDLWHEGDPMRGSACEGRCLSVDYGPCQTLAAAAQVANIQYGTTLFPVKTVMWISPGKVRVRAGYSAPEITIFGDEESPASIA